MALCFYCGGALFQWTEADIPFIEQAKFFPTGHISDTSSDTPSFATNTANIASN